MTYLFQIPAALQAGVASGEIVRFGALLKNASTGQIVAHLQETGLMQLAIGGLSSSPIGGVLKAGTFVAEGLLTHSKLNAIQGQLQVLQSIGLLNLGVSIAGVAGSVACIGYMRHRFNKLEQRLETIGDEIKNLVKESDLERRRSFLRTELSKIKTSLRRMEESKALTARQDRYKEVSHSLDYSAGWLREELHMITSASRKISIEEVRTLTEALCLCNSIALECEIRLNELKLAEDKALKVAEDYQSIFDNLNPTSFSDSLEESHLFCLALRDITEASISKPYLIQHLRTQRMDGNAFLNEAEKEQDKLLLALTVN